MVWDRVVAKTPCKDRFSQKIKVRFQLIMPKNQYNDFFLTMLIKQEIFHILGLYYFELYSPLSGRVNTRSIIIMIILLFMVEYTFSFAEIMNIFFIFEQIDGMLNVVGHRGSSAVTIEGSQIRNPDVCQEKYSSSNPRGTQVRFIAQITKQKGNFHMNLKFCYLT